MTDLTRTLESVPVAVAVSIFFAGIMWYASAVQTPGLTSSNEYFYPGTVDCGQLRVAEADGYMAHWMRE